MHNSYKKLLFTLSFCFCLENLSVHATIINQLDQEPPVAQELIFQNRSILKCSAVRDETILTLLDVEALLAISNSISKTSVPLTTQWAYFTAPKINLYRVSDQIPLDVLRILFLCLNWQDTKLANLFAVSDAELQNRLDQIRENPPWNMYSPETQKKISELSDSYLKELIDMILRADLAEPVRGNLKTNQSLKSIKFIWLL